MLSITWNFTWGTLVATLIIVVAAYNWGGWDFGITQRLRLRLQRR